MLSGVRSTRVRATAFVVHGSSDSNKQVVYASHPRLGTIFWLSIRRLTRMNYLRSERSFTLIGLRYLWPACESHFFYRLSLSYPTNYFVYQNRLERLGCADAIWKLLAFVSQNMPATFQLRIRKELSAHHARKGPQLSFRVIGESRQLCLA